MKAAPITNRIDSLDLIRGVAILGILIMNITSFSQIGMAYLNPKLGAGIDGINGWIYSFAFLFADMRFMSMFSILFGAGMMLFVQNIEQKELKPFKYHHKRMFLLLGFGLIHAHLIWMGDILVPYAICGCLVFLFFLSYLLRNRPWERHHRFLRKKLYRVRQVSSKLAPREAIS